MPIQILDDNVISQIAAGEVIERPASVVKELIENAIDAGATQIYVETLVGGRRLVRVSDDGIGIPSDEAPLAFMRHATSKLRTSDDLLSIRTLGFRGEALASIAAVSHVTLTTRHREDNLGIRIRVEGGQIVHRQAVGAPTGTVIMVENLFFNTPARLKFLKADTTEKRHILNMVSRYAIAYPQIRFVLNQDGKETFRTHGNGRLADVVMIVLGIDNFRQMLEVAEEITQTHGPSIRIYGYVSNPELHRIDRTRIMLFVNGRSIQDNSLSHAITQAYHGLMEHGNFPYAVLLIEMPTDFVDVNVHPTKAEVRFQDANVVFIAVQKAVRNAVLAATSLPISGHANRISPLIQGWERTWAGAKSDEPEQTELNLNLTDSGRFPQREFADKNIPYSMEAPIKPRTLPVLRIVGQIGATYIIAEGPAGLYLIDQNAAHERLLYETLLASYRNNETILSDTIDEAISIQLTPSQMTLIERFGERFVAFGFGLEPFGPNTILLRQVPSILKSADPAIYLPSLISDLEGAIRDRTIEFDIQLIIQMASAAAIRSGQILSREEMHDLVSQLERCPSPLTAPDGRPTLIHISAEQLAREFRRH